MYVPLKDHVQMTKVNCLKVIGLYQACFFAGRRFLARAGHGPGILGCGPMQAADFDLFLAYFGRILRNFDKILQNLSCGPMRATQKLARAGCGPPKMAGPHTALDARDKDTNEKRHKR